jgi:hypothetical protein
MKMSRTITLNDDDIFRAVKNFITDHVDGVNATEVCNYRIRFEGNNDQNKPIIYVELEDKSI